MLNRTRKDLVSGRLWRKRSDTRWPPKSGLAATSLLISASCWLTLSLKRAASCSGVTPSFVTLIICTPCRPWKRTRTEKVLCGAKTDWNMSCSWSCESSSWALSLEASSRKEKMTLFSLLFTCWTVGPLLLKRSASIFSSVMKLAGAFLSTRAIRMG